MEAGVKLDILMAEIMGWTEVSADIPMSLLELGTVFMVTIDDFDVCDGQERVFTRSAWQGEARRWEPSTNVSQALQVMEKIRADDLSGQTMYTIWSPSLVRDEYYVGVGIPGMNMAHGYASDLALAICKAASLARPNIESGHSKGKGNA